MKGSLLKNYFGLPNIHTHTFIQLCCCLGSLLVLLDLDLEKLFHQLIVEYHKMSVAPFSVPSGPSGSSL